jgi:hypothetical protein
MIWKNSSGRSIARQFTGRYFLDIASAFKTLADGDTESFKAIVRAHYDFWKGFHATYQKRRLLQQKRKVEDNPPVMLKNSIVWEYFISGKRKFGEIFNRK